MKEYVFYVPFNTLLFYWDSNLELHGWNVGWWSFQTYAYWDEKPCY